MGRGQNRASRVLVRRRRPLRALMAEVEREASPDLAVVSERWARVSEAVRATLRARIADVQAMQGLKR